MNIHILFDFIQGPYGGGNQFLKALKNEFIRRGEYCNDPLQASVVIFNSHHLPENVWSVKQANKEAVFIHRLDGPMRLFTSATDKRDSIAYLMNSFANGTVFQSEYSHKGNIAQGLNALTPHTVISNAPDPKIFYPKKPKARSGKLSLVATSWSGNIKKGFDVYEWLDNNLDFSRYEMTFIGNSPVEFKNITLISPLPSVQLADELRKRDVYITASRNDPCSNALIEALNCGLVSLARNSGGHPEIVGEKSLLFDEPTEIPGILERVESEYDAIRQCLAIRTIEDIARQYSEFAALVMQQEKRTLSGKQFRQTVDAIRAALGLEKESRWGRLCRRLFGKGL